MLTPGKIYRAFDPANKGRYIYFLATDSFHPNREVPKHQRLVNLQSYKIVGANLPHYEILSQRDAKITINP